MPTFYRWDASSINWSEQEESVSSNQKIVLLDRVDYIAYYSSEKPTLSKDGYYVFTESQRYLPYKGSNKYVAALSKSRIMGYSSQPYITSGGENNKQTIFWDYGGAPTQKFQAVASKGTFAKYAISDSPEEYPTNGEKGNYWYSNRTSFSVSISVPKVVLQEKEIKISWTKTYPGASAENFSLDRKIGDGDWETIYSGTDSSYIDTAGEWGSVKYRISVFVYGNIVPYVESNVVSVEPSSSFLISGEDGDLGVISSDIEYTILCSSDDEITVTEQVIGVYSKTFSAISGEVNKINILDLLSGTGNVVITASTNFEQSGVIQLNRNWSYTKKSVEFTSIGDVSQLAAEEVSVWPITIAEAVRIPGGKTLDKEIFKIESGEYTGTGKSSQSNPNSLTAQFDIGLVFISGSNNSFACIGSKAGLMQAGGSGSGSITEEGIIQSEISGNTISWSSGNDVRQMNVNGVKYSYVILRG